jgi:hypothetical protein
VAHTLGLTRVAYNLTSPFSILRGTCVPLGDVACTLTPGCGQHSKCNNCPCQDSTHSPMLQSRPHNSVHPAFSQVLHVPIYVLQGLARFGAGLISPRVWTTVEVQQLLLPGFWALPMLQSRPHNSVHSWPSSIPTCATCAHIWASGVSQVWCKSYKPQGVDSSGSATTVPARILGTPP